MSFIPNFNPHFNTIRIYCILLKFNFYQRITRTLIKDVFIRAQFSYIYLYTKDI